MGIYGDLWGFIGIYRKVYGDINPNKSQPGFIKNQYYIYIHNLYLAFQLLQDMASGHVKVIKGTGHVLLRVYPTARQTDITT